MGCVTDVSGGYAASIVRVKVCIIIIQCHMEADVYSQDYGIQMNYCILLITGLMHVNE
jgi:hypothetical protein